MTNFVSVLSATAVDFDGSPIRKSVLCLTKAYVGDKTLFILQLPDNFLRSHSSVRVNCERFFVLT